MLSVNHLVKHYILIACGILVAFLAYSLNFYINREKMPGITKIIFIFFSFMILITVAYVFYGTLLPETNNSMTNSNSNIITPNTEPIAAEQAALVLVINEARAPGLYQYITPHNGSLNSTYTYTFSSKDFPSDLFLEIKDPRTNSWKPFGKGKWNLDHITFVVPDLSFIEPVFLGSIEFRLKNNEGNPIYNSTGPNIIINFKNIMKNTSSKTISMDVIPAICKGDIYLQSHKTTLIERYTGCGNWQRLNFGPLKDMNDEDIISTGICKVEYIG